MAIRVNPKLIDDLVERGLVDRQGSSIDRRKISLDLTAGGREMAESSFRATQAAYVDRFATLPAETLAIITQAMRDLQIIFSSDKPES